MRKPINRFIGPVAWVLFACWAAGIVGLSSMSGDQMNRFLFGIPNFDKVLHTTAFAIGAILLGVALRQTTRWPMRVLFPLVILAVSLFGLTDEMHQLFTPHRSGGDLWDWLADTLGATLGSLASYVSRRGGTAAAAPAEASLRA